VQNYNSKLKTKKKVLNFKLWFFVFRFKFLVLTINYLFKYHLLEIVFSRYPFTPLVSGCRGRIYPTRPYCGLDESSPYIIPTVL